MQPFNFLARLLERFPPALDFFFGSPLEKVLILEGRLPADCQAAATRSPRASSEGPFTGHALMVQPFSESG